MTTSKLLRDKGTVALEMLATHADLEVLFVPVGGGGLIAGNAIAAKSLCPQIKIIGVQTKRFPSMLKALQGEPIVCGRATMAEGIAVKTPGQITLPIIRELVDDILLVDEEEIEEAVRLLLEIEKTLVEGAGAAGLAALIKYSDRFIGQKVGIILSGGNIDLPILAEIVQRSMVRSGRLVKLEVEIRDMPGVLADVTRYIADTGANIVEVHHQREFSCLPLKSADLELVLMTQGT